MFHPAVPASHGLRDTSVNVNEETQEEKDSEANIAYIYVTYIHKCWEAEFLNIINSGELILTMIFVAIVNSSS